MCTFVRRRNGLSWSPALLVVSYPGGSSDDPVAWEFQLEQWLWDHGVRAIDPANEAERFGYGLEAQLEPVERRYGSGCFNAVLYSYLRDSGFAGQRAIRLKLEAIHGYRPELSYEMIDCAMRIKAVFGANGRTLQSLGYGQDEAIEIVSNAIAYYLDDRFNIHTRALLGLG